MALHEGIQCIDPNLRNLFFIYGSSPGRNGSGGDRGGGFPISLDGWAAT